MRVTETKVTLTLRATDKEWRKLRLGSLGFYAIQLTTLCKRTGQRQIRVSPDDYNHLVRDLRKLGVRFD